MGQLWRILRGPAAKNGRAKRTHTAV
jgi:hypothetical protein